MSPTPEVAAKKHKIAPLAADLLSLEFLTLKSNPCQYDTTNRLCFQVDCWANLCDIGVFQYQKAGFRKLNLEILPNRAVVAILRPILGLIFAKGLP